MHTPPARRLVKARASRRGLATALLDADQSSEAGIASQRERVLALRQKLAGMKVDEARRLETFADYLVKKSVWLIGGDGWAYDIGYGGLDHVLANRRDVNILVWTPRLIRTREARRRRPHRSAPPQVALRQTGRQKDLGLLAVYGHVYVARGRVRREDGADGAGVRRGRSSGAV
jgi:pyruvate-ferredoxin/flavodoxin oxidoreductase